MTLTAALLLLAAPAAAAPSWCAKLRYEAVKLPAEFSPSHDNYINCGVDGGRPSNYAFLAEPEATVEMHVVAVQQGSFSGRRPGADKERAVEVFVYKTARPALLVLSAARPTLWEITATKDADIDRVVVQGPPPQRVRGLPAGVPLLTREEHLQCKAAHGWEKRINRGGSRFKEMITSIRCGMGLRETSFQGCREGAVFEIPFTRRGAAARAAPAAGDACPLALPPEDISPLAVPVQAARPPGGEPRYSTEPRRKRPPRPAPQTPNIPGRGAQTPTLFGRAEPAAETLPRPNAPAPRGEVPVRALAILERGDLGLLTPDAVPDIIVALEKGAESLRARAAEALGNVRPKAPAALKPLTRALKDESPRVAANAALALGKLGADADSAVGGLKRALRHRHPDVRLAAETALERIDTRKARRALKRRRR